jgi:hypothetical protein
VKKTSKKHSRYVVFHYDNIKYVSFNLSLFKIVIIIIIMIISSARREAIWGSGDTAQIYLQVSASLPSSKCATGPTE